MDIYIDFRRCKDFSSLKIAATNPTAYLLDYEISSVVDTVDSRAPVSSMTGTLLFSMRADIYLCSGRSVTKRKIYIYIEKTKIENVTSSFSCVIFVER